MLDFRPVSGRLYIASRVDVTDHNEKMQMVHCGKVGAPRKLAIQVSESLPVNLRPVLSFKKLP